VIQDKETFQLVVDSSKKSHKFMERANNMSQRHKVISVSLSYCVDDELEAEASARRISKSRLIEHALLRELDRNPKRNQKKTEEEAVPI
jgi:post-segregation antitoxin (ccd killing protein)